MCLCLCFCWYFDFFLLLGFEVKVACYVVGWWLLVVCSINNEIEMICDAMQINNGRWDREVARLLAFCSGALFLAYLGRFACSINERVPSRQTTFLFLHLVKIKEITKIETRCTDLDASFSASQTACLGPSFNLLRGRCKQKHAFPSPIADCGLRP